MFGKTIKRVYVLGAGPAGLLAAEAAGQKGLEVAIFSKPGKDGRVAKSELFGCQYLHEPIPGVTQRGERREVSYTLRGGIEAYRRKVYGDGWMGSVSPDEFGPEQDHAAWDLRAAYNRLWDKWQPKMTAGELGPGNLEVLRRDTYAVVLCSVPAPALCRSADTHKFAVQSVYAIGSTGQNVLPYVAPENTVECNAEDGPRWYRAATVFGYSTLEWPAGAKPPISGVVPVQKPLSTDCQCWVGPRWHRIGRYGKWQKGVLVHTAFTDAKRAVA